METLDFGSVNCKNWTTLVESVGNGKGSAQLERKDI